MGDYNSSPEDDKDKSFVDTDGADFYFAKSNRSEKTKLVIDENTIYEIDLDCCRKKHFEDA